MSITEEKEEKVFNYYDITANFGDSDYKVGTLLTMDEDKFTEIYELYKKSIAKKIYDIENNRLATLGVAPVIDLMERIRLERKINKLEKLNKF